MLTGKTSTYASRSFFAAASTGFDATLMTEMAKFRVSPAAGWWMRSYGVLPSQLIASGPKGFILKGDVLSFIDANKLGLRPREVPKAATPAKAGAEKKPAAAKKTPQNQAASPAFNPDDPFQ